jgi:GntR family transcriptional regulator/MocR family aminotransferase
VVLTPAHQWPTGVVLAPERRRALIAWATEHDATAVELSGLAAGFHAVGNLPGSVDEQAVVAAARDRSVGLYGMSAYRSTGVTTPPQLVLGFGSLGERTIQAGIAAVGDLLQAGA